MKSVEIGDGGGIFGRIGGWLWRMGYTELHREDTELHRELWNEEFGVFCRNGKGIEKIKVKGGNMNQEVNLQCCLPEALDDRISRPARRDATPNAGVGMKNEELVVFAEISKGNGDRDAWPCVCTVCVNR